MTYISYIINIIIKVFIGSLASMRRKACAFLAAPLRLLFLSTCGLWAARRGVLDYSTRGRSAFYFPQDAEPADALGCQPATILMAHTHTATPACHAVDGVSFGQRLARYDFSTRAQAAETAGFAACSPDALGHAKLHRPRARPFGISLPRLSGRDAQRRYDTTFRA